MKKTLLLLLSLVLTFNLAACTPSTPKPAPDKISTSSFDTMLEEAKGTTVTFYGWGGSQHTNDWIDGPLAAGMKKEYNITVKRVGMNIDEILNILLNEKKLNVEKGNIDVIWINGENFFTATQNKLLHGPFTQLLPNFNKYIDTTSPDNTMDFGYPINGYEAPYGKAQLVIVYDSTQITKTPKNHKELLEFAKNNPGKITYPAPPDFTGSAFVRNIIYDIVGYEQFMALKADESAVRQAIAPAITYFKDLKPYLWRQGKTYPADLALLDNMYADGEVLMSMSYNPNAASVKIATGEFKKSTRTFIFDKGSIGNTHFVAIPFNAPNKAGAHALINYILSVESQATKYDPAIWGDLPVLDNTKLNQAEKDRFAFIALGAATLPQHQLLQSRLPEMPAHLVPIIEKIWLEEIPE